MIAKLNTTCIGEIVNKVQKGVIVNKIRVFFEEGCQQPLSEPF